MILRYKDGWSSRNIATYVFWCLINDVCSAESHPRSCQGRGRSDPVSKSLTPSATLRVGLVGLAGLVVSTHPTNIIIIELDDGKIYRKPLYLMVKTMVSCTVDFPLNQSIDIMFCDCSVCFPINIQFDDRSSQMETSSPKMAARKLQVRHLQ